MKTRYIIPLFLALGVALLAAGCGGMLMGKEAAESSRVDFHKFYNEGELEQIYAGAHSKLHAATSEKDFPELMGAVQKKLGKVTGTTSAGYRVKSKIGTTTVVLTQTTVFEKGSGKEIFTFQMDGEVAVLVGYNINSKELIL
tara:strand:- start:1113 stop:1538 length:426 start_codon:yes stop_codon:yes gene_type:complete